MQRPVLHVHFNDNDFSQEFERACTDFLAAATGGGNVGDDGVEEYKKPENG